MRSTWIGRGHAAAAVACVLAATASSEAAYTFNSLGGTVTESFDGYGGSGNPTHFTSNVTVWRGVEAGTGSTAGGGRSYNGNTLGYLGSSTAGTDKFFETTIVNNTGSLISELIVSSEIQQYKVQSARPSFFDFSLTGIGAVGTYTGFTSGTTTKPPETLSQTFGGLSIAPGDLITLRWDYNGGGGSGSRQGLGINSFSVTANGVTSSTPDINLTSANTVDFGTIIAGIATQGQFSLQEIGGAAATYNASGTSADVTSIVASGSIAANGADTVTVTVDTATAGAKSATANISGDGINENVAVNGIVLDPSNAQLVGSDNIDLGAFNIGDAGVIDLVGKITNAVATAGFTAALDLDDVQEASDADGKFSLAALFSQLAAGTSGDLQTTIDTSEPGVFTASYTFLFSDEDLAGASAFGSQSLTLNVIATVVPEPASIALAGLGLLALASRRRSVRERE